MLNTTEETNTCSKTSRYKTTVSSKSSSSPEFAAQRYNKHRFGNVENPKETPSRQSSPK